MQRLEKAQMSYDALLSRLSHVKQKDHSKFCGVPPPAHHPPRALVNPDSPPPLSFVFNSCPTNSKE